MKTMQKILLAGLGLAVSACTAVDVPTRNVPFEQLPTSAVSAPVGYQSTEVGRASIDATSLAPISSASATANAAPAQSGANSLAAPLQLHPGHAPVTVKSVSVYVPRSLKVSEANRYLPRGDIVWREDPIGDRHAQVQKIVQDALSQGVAGLNGPVEVNLAVNLVRFHALTEKARYTTGGVHSITFDLALVDPKTGELLTEPRQVRADLDAFGGQQAINAVAHGQTQKVRISNHLAEVIRQELSKPEGYENASLGFYQVLNNL